MSTSLAWEEKSRLENKFAAGNPGRFYNLNMGFLEKLFENLLAFKVQSLFVSLHHPFLPVICTILNPSNRNNTFRCNILLTRSDDESCVSADLHMKRTGKTSVCVLENVQLSFIRSIHARCLPLVVLTIPALTTAFHQPMTRNCTMISDDLSAGGNQAFDTFQNVRRACQEFAAIAWFDRSLLGSTGSTHGSMTSATGVGSRDSRMNLETRISRQIGDVLAGCEWSGKPGIIAAACPCFFYHGVDINLCESGSASLRQVVEHWNVVDDGLKRDLEQAKQIVDRENGIGSYLAENDVEMDELVALMTK